MSNHSDWPSRDLRLTPAQAEFLMTGDVRCVSPKIAARTEDSLARRKMITWRGSQEGFFLRANAKGLAAMEKHRALKLAADNDNKAKRDSNAA